MNNYLAAFKVNPFRYNTLMTALFLILEKLLKRANSSCFNFSFIPSIVAKSFPPILGRGKSQRGPSPVNTVVEA